MLSNVGHSGIYRAGRGAGNRALRTGAVMMGTSFLFLGGCARQPDAGAAGRAGDIVVTHAVAWGAADVKAATVGMEISNQGDVTDTLVAVTSPAGNATLHTEAPGQGMRPIPALPLQRRSAIRIGRGLHIMIEELATAPSAGKSIPVTLRFAHAGPMELSIPVLRYSEALTALGE